MTYVQDFPSLAPLPVITDHQKLPKDARLLGSMVLHGKLRDELFSLVARGMSHLSVLISTTYKFKDGSARYTCIQSDFPLEVLSWFPKALEEFRKPPAMGGLHAGAMISDYADIDGEMLTVGRTTEGYRLTNWSRTEHGNSTFAPIELFFDSDFLYKDGFLQLWQDLGERYKQGKL